MAEPPVAVLVASLLACAGSVAACVVAVRSAWPRDVRKRIERVEAIASECEMAVSDLGSVWERTKVDFAAQAEALDDLLGQIDKKDRRLRARENRERAADPAGGAAVDSREAARLRARSMGFRV